MLICVFKGKEEDIFKCKAEVGVVGKRKAVGNPNNHKCRKSEVKRRKAEIERKSKKVFPYCAINLNFGLIIF